MTSLPNVSDEYLIQQFAQGDLLAFDSLYNRHVKTVYNRVRYVIPETDVEDVTQDVFLAVLNSLSNFRGEAQFATWLFTVTNNKIAEYHRRRSRKKETMQVDLIEADKQSDHSDRGSLEDHIDLQIAMSRLPERYREIILSRFADGLPFEAIAKRLKKNTEATKSLFRRALSALRENWEETDEENQN